VGPQRHGMLSAAAPPPRSEACSRVHPWVAPAEGSTGELNEAQGNEPWWTAAGIRPRFRPENTLRRVRLKEGLLRLNAVMPTVVVQFYSAKNRCPTTRSISAPSDRRVQRNLKSRGHSEKVPHAQRGAQFNWRNCMLGWPLQERPCKLPNMKLRRLRIGSNPANPHTFAMQRPLLGVRSPNPIDQ